MRSLLIGFGGVSPKSFSALIAKAPLESKEWILDVLHGVSAVFFIMYSFFWWVDLVIE
jgi:hypothetical protein